LSGVSFLDFERGKDLVVIGEAAAQAAVPRLARLAVSPEKYAIWELDRTRRPTFHGQAIAEVRIEGTVRTNPEALRREVRDRVGIEIGSDPTDEQLVKAARVLHGLGDFERVDVRSRVEEGRRIVVVDVDEKPWGPNYLRFGGQAVATQGDSRFSLIVQHTHTWLNSWGAEWRNEVTIGDLNRLETSLYQPLGPGSPWFVEGSLAAGRSDFDLFENRFHPSDRITTSSHGFATFAGRRLGGIGVARFGVGRQWFTTRPAISSRIDATTTDSADFALLGANFDTLDDTNFPRRGYLVSGSTTRYWFDSATSPVQAYVAETLLPFTYDRLTFLGIASAGTSTSEHGSFGLGGFFALSGTPAGAISGSNVLAGALLGYYRMGDLPRTVGRAWYAGGSLEAGNAWTNRSDVSLGDMRKAGSIFVGLDTVIGPLYAGWGHTFGGQSAFYLFLGRPTTRLQRDF
jgi:NTE family protein